MIHNGRALNWKPSRPKKFGRKYLSLGEMLGQALPHNVDLRPQCAPIKDQGQFGACSGFSSSVCTEFLELMELRSKGDPSVDPQEYVKDKFVPASPMFIYNNERIIEGTPLTQDAGATSLGDASKALETLGVCREVTFPYTAENLTIKPPQEAYDEAKAHKIPLDYELEQDHLHLMTCLAAGYPFLFGVSVFDSFMSDESAKTGIIKLPTSEDNQIGGHALACVGARVGLYWIFQNSWGTNWGAQGFGFLPWRYMLDPDLADDFYTLRYKADTNG